MNIKHSTRFKKDFKRFSTSGCRKEKRLKELKEVLGCLANKKSLDANYRDHGLVGVWHGYRECHIEPDFLLIYCIHEEANTLELARLGNHSELFG